MAPHTNDEIVWAAREMQVRKALDDGFWALRRYALEPFPEYVDLLHDAIRRVRENGFRPMLLRRQLGIIAIREDIYVKMSKFKEVVPDALANGTNPGVIEPDNQLRPEPPRPTVP